MIRLLAAALLTAGAATGQFVEISVDAAVREGEIRPVFGLDAPAEPRDVKLLLERGLAAPVRIGPGAAMRAELAERLESAWPDAAERQAYEGRRDEPAVWTLDAGSDGGVADAAAVLSRAAEIEAPAAYHKRRRWFGDDGRATPVLPALELGSRLMDSPRRVPVSEAEERLTALAGVSVDGETVQVLLVRRAPAEDTPPPPPAYALYVRNLPWGASSFSIERFRLDMEHEDERVGAGAGRGGIARVTARFEGPAVELIVLRKTDADGSGVIRRRKGPARQSSP